MEATFLKLVNMSITASYLAIAVMLLRLLLKKAPKWVFVALWAMVGLRLMLPISIESIFSLVPNPEPLPQTILVDPVPQVQTGIPFVNSTINPILETAMTAAPGDSVNPMQVWGSIASILWCLGMAIMAAYTLFSYLILRVRVRESVKLWGNTYQCDRIPSPFILGILFPRIYLPSNIADADIPYVIAHENAHLKRLDHIWKPLGFVLLTVYWFNPILWVAYILLCRDVETACDEKVLKAQGADIKKAYSQALLNCSVSRRSIAACPLAFGEVGVKQRIKNVLNYKRPAFWVILIALVLSLAVGICFLTNPRSADIPPEPTDPTEPADPTEMAELGELEFQICQWIKEANEGRLTDRNYATVNYEILGKEDTPQGITVYMWVLYAEYSYHGELDCETASYMLTAITAEKQEGNNYRLVEYWTPEAGSRYQDSIKEKLPEYLLHKALNSQSTLDALSQMGLTKAKLFFGLIDGEVPAISQDHPAYEKWFDPDSRDTAPSRMELADNPGMALVLKDNRIFLENRGELSAISVASPLAVYLADLDGDGSREICAMEVLGSEVVVTSVWVYDLRTGTRKYINYIHQNYNYGLTEKYGKLYLTRAECDAEYCVEKYESGAGLFLKAIDCRDGSPVEDKLHPLVPLSIETANGFTMPPYEPAHTREEIALIVFKRSPQYSGMDVSNGLTIYVWQLAQGHYACVPVPDQNHVLSDIELMRILQMPHITLAEMRAIIDGYGLSGENIRVVPIHVPYSSYYYAIDEAYTRQLRLGLELKQEYEAQKP